MDNKAWKDKYPPKKILAMRFQALGDVVITFPYLQSLRQIYPHAKIHFLTRAEDANIPKSMYLFDKVISIRGGRINTLQWTFGVCKLPFLIFQKYDVIVDLQNHQLSRFIRKLAGPKAWVSFDKYSPISAGERNRLTMEKIGLGSIQLDTNLNTRITNNELDIILKKAGWNGLSQLVILNPAGFFSSRQWPLENYIVFTQLLLHQKPGVQFLFLGVTRIAQKANYIKSKLGNTIIDLTNQTTASQAFALVKRCGFVLTEDSGLMHMAWVQGVPTLALFGSTRYDWSAPLGKWSLCLHSGDLPCGACLLSECKFGDTRCLTRYTPDYVLEKALRLMKTNT